MTKTSPRCELCGRPVKRRTRHHLIPRKRHRAKRERRRFTREEMRGAIAMLCSPCHKMVHATLSETELAQHYHTLEALRGHAEIAKFIAWVRKQPADTQVTVRMTSDRRDRRKRR